MHYLYTTLTVVFGVFLAVLGLSWLGVLSPAPSTSTGSVSVSSEYRHLLTGENSGIDNTQVLKTAQGTLGSVIITGAQAGHMTVYNATTSDVTLRALATSSLDVLAHIPSSAAAGTYTFDAEANRGLLLVVEGTQPTTTITYR